MVKKKRKNSYTILKMKDRNFKVHFEIFQQDKFGEI